MENEQKFITDKIPISNSIITRTIITLSIISRWSSPDYNIIIGFLLLFFRGVNNSEKQKIISRVKVQLLVISHLFGLLSLLKNNSYQTHGEETGEFWQSLSFAHNLTFYRFICEIMLKINLCFVLYKEFKANQGITKDFLNFDYKTKTEIVNHNF